MGLSNPDLNNGEHPANNNPPQNITGKNCRVIVISNNIGSKQNDVIIQYPVNKYLLFPPSK